MSETTAFNHVGQCVTDLARSRQFYEEVFGFTCERTLEPPDDPSATLLQLEPPVGMSVAYLRRDGLVLELLEFARAGNPPFRPRVMNEPGLTHLSLSVEDLETVAKRVRDFGGSVVDETRIPGAFFIRDPDGQLVELLPMEYRRRLDSH